MKLFLIVFDLRTSQYMSDSTEEKGKMRIVWADDEGQAIDKLKAVYPDNEYSTYYEVSIKECEEAIA